MRGVLQRAAKHIDPSIEYVLCEAFSEKVIQLCVIAANIQYVSKPVARKDPLNFLES